MDIARALLAEIQQHEADPEIEEKQGKLEQLKSVLEMYVPSLVGFVLLFFYLFIFLLCRYGHFSGINRKVQMKYQPKGRPRGSSSDDGKPSISTNILFIPFMFCSFQCLLLYCIFLDFFT